MKDLATITGKFEKLFLKHKDFTLKSDEHGNYGVFHKGNLIRNHRRDDIGVMAFDSAKSHFLQLAMKGCNYPKEKIMAFLERSFLEACRESESKDNE